MNILITSAGRRSYFINYFKDVLRDCGLVFASNSEHSPALLAADHFVISPSIYSEEYISFLLNYCEKHKIEAIISLFDIDLPVLSKAKSIFRSRGIEVIVSEYEITQICNDKIRTFEFLVANGFDTPKVFFNPESACAEIALGNLCFPVVVKPRWGMGSIGIYVADDEGELRILYKKVQKKVVESYLKYESQVAPDCSVIIQELMKGQEYGLDVINDLKQDYVCTFVKKKLAMRAGETDQAVTVDCSILRDVGKKISETLKHIACLDVDCFMLDNKPFVLELNCRFGGGYPFSHLAGANIPLAIVQWLKGQMPPPELFKIEYGVVAAKNIVPTRLKL